MREPEKIAERIGGFTSRQFRARYPNLSDSGAKARLEKMVEQGIVEIVQTSVVFDGRTNIKVRIFKMKKERGSQC